MKTFIFDLDGTLVNTLDDIAYNINLMLKQFGLKEHSVEEITAMVGNGAKRLVTEALPQEKRSEAFVKEALEVYQSYYDKNLIIKTFVYEGLSETLKQLKKQGCKLAVMSNKDSRHVTKVVDALLPNVFDRVKGYDGVYPHKPSPESTLSLIQAFESDPKETFFVGDSSVDVLTAKNAGVKSVGVAWGFWGERSFYGCEPDILIHHPEQLLLL